jgi:hypothetical protein
MSSNLIAGSSVQVEQLTLNQRVAGLIGSFINRRGKDVEGKI